MATVLLAVAVILLALHLALLGRWRARERERKAASLESSAMAEALVRNSPRGIHFYELDDADRLVFRGYNPAADRILGIDHSLLVGKTIEEAFPSLTATEVPARYLAAARDGAPWSTEQVEYEDDAIKGAYEVIAFRTRPRAMAAIFSDITGRKRDEAELRRLNRELERERAFTKTLLDSLPGIFYLYDYPGLKLVAWNRNHEIALGYGEGDIRGMSIRDWHVQESRQSVIEAVERCMAEGEASIEAPLVAKDGRLIPFLLTGKRFEAEGRPYLMGVGIDISARAAAEEELKRLNQELEDRVVERTRLLSEANTALENALRELKETQARTLLSEKMATVGRLVASLAHELNSPLGAIISAAEGSSAAVASLGGALKLYRSLDGPEAAAFSELAGGLRVAGVPASGEERRLLRRHRAALERAGIEKPELVAEQLAELGYDGAEDRVAALAGLPRFAPIVAAIHHIASIARADYVVGVAARKAARVVAALGTYARGGTAEPSVPDDVRAQIDTVLLLLENRTAGRIEVVREYAEIPRVACYPDRLSLVWMNLATNAIQAMGGRGRLEIATRRSGDRVEVSVADDGPGIPDSVRDRVFEPFVTTKAAGEGLGLGLDICRRVLEEIGASIRFESRPGRTVFTVSLGAGKAEADLGTKG